jgi:hypothetical protein
MKMNAGSQPAFSDRRVLLSIVAFVGSFILGLFACGELSVALAQPWWTKSDANFTQADVITARFPVTGQNF